MTVKCLRPGYKPSAGLTRAEREACIIRVNLIEKLSDTSAGALSRAAWKRIEAAYDAELERERCPRGRRDHG